MNNILKEYHKKLKSTYLLNKLNNPDLELIVYENGNFCSNIFEDEILSLKEKGKLLFNIGMNPDDTGLVVNLSYDYFNNNIKLNNYIDKFINSEDGKKIKVVYFGTFEFALYGYYSNHIMTDIIDILLES